MKKTLLLTLALIAGIVVFGQNSNLVVFTDIDGAAFKVIMNGETINKEFKKRVKAENLLPKAYKLKIVFEDEYAAEQTRTFELKPDTEVTLTLVKQDEVSKGFGRIGKNVVRNATGKDLDAGKKEKKYVIRFLSEARLGNTAKSHKEANQTKKNSGKANIGVKTDQSVTVTETVSDDGTYSVTTSDADGNVHSVNMDVTATDNSFSIDISESGNTVESGTVVVTTETTAEHYVMPGYTGKIGCAWPVNESEFNSVVNSIKSKDFEDTKLTVAKQFTKNHCLFASQVRQIMQQFTYEDSKLEFAKFAYKHTYDISNYYKVNDAFEFEMTIEELNEFINAQ